MDNFNKQVELILQEMAANISGGTADVASSFGTNAGDAIGSSAGQFPAQNSKGYNNGNNLPVAPANLALGAKKKRSKKNKKVTTKIPLQRRHSIYL